MSHKTKPSLKKRAACSTRKKAKVKRELCSGKSGAYRQFDLVLIVMRWATWLQSSWDQWFP